MISFLLFFKSIKYFSIFLLDKWLFCSKNFVNLFVRPSVCLPAACLSVCLSACCLPVYLSICLSVSFFITVFLSYCLSFLLSFFLTVFLSYCLSFILPFCLSLCLFVCLSVCLLSDYQFVSCQSIGLSVSLSISHSLHHPRFALCSPLSNLSLTFLIPITHYFLMLNCG